MINALNNTRRNTRQVVLASAGVAVVLGLSACGGSTSESAGDAELPAPVAETTVVAADTASPETARAETAVVETAAAEPQAEGQPIVTDQFIPASSPDFPCGEYVEATELPVLACSQGPLVEDFQNWAAYASMDVTVDGFFGAQTHEAVVEFQRRFGLLETGVIDQVLMDTLEGRLNHDEPVEDEESGD